MRLKKISNSDIKELLKCCVKEWDVYVPLEIEHKDILFTSLPKEENKLKDALEKVNLKDEWTVISPKDLFFPQLETMFYFDKQLITSKCEGSKKLIFGIKPCDVKGILFSDEFFKRNFEDIYYLTRANNRLIVTIGCRQPPRPQSCFCASAKTGPFLENGYDLQLTDTNGDFLVEAGSKTGEEFINAYPDLFKAPDNNADQRLKEIKSKAAKALNVCVDFQKALETMKIDKDFEENYRRIGERCIYCGGCVYTCPTCTCFNVFDDKIGESGVRKRNWDTCMFKGYTREASGHNPREEKKDRTARRYEHKLKYDYQVAGMSGCIGCGRCLASCPVNIGMSKFIEEITANKRIM